MQTTWNNGSKSNLDNVNTCRLYFFAKGNSTQKSEVGVGRRRYSTPRYHDASREVFSRRTQQSFQCMNNSHGENQIGATIMSHFQGQRCLLQFYILTMGQWVCAVCAVQSIFLVFVVAVISSTVWFYESLKLNRYHCILVVTQHNHVYKSPFLNKWPMCTSLPTITTTRGTLKYDNRVGMRLRRQPSPVG